MYPKILSFCTTLCLCGQTGTEAENMTVEEIEQWLSLSLTVRKYKIIYIRVCLHNFIEYDFVGKYFLFEYMYILKNKMWRENKALISGKNRKQVNRKWI